MTAEEREVHAAQQAMLVASGYLEPSERGPRPAHWWWRRVALVWEQRAGVAEARADRAEKEVAELRERVHRLDRALDQLAGPAR